MTTTLTNSTLIAPCGIDCGVCRGHLRKRNPCPGCRHGDADKPKTRVLCRIKTCDQRLGGKMKFCFGCNEFPCKILKRMDDRYRSKYEMSVIDNLVMIRTSGVRKFIASENQRWICSACGGTLCVHEPRCPGCGHARSQG